MKYPFWVYRNWTRKRAALHVAECGHCNNGKGVHDEDSGQNGGWKGFMSFSEALAFLNSFGYKDARLCKVCSPTSGNVNAAQIENGPWENQAFTIAHADDGKFEAQGLRAFFEYRDLGINAATKGKFGAHVIRAVPGMESPGTWHSHDLDFQMVYVTKGWVVFEYEGPKEQGGGEHTLREGSCVLQPSGIKHREVRHSDDLELIEIISPAAFDTQDETAP